MQGVLQKPLGEKSHQTSVAKVTPAGGIAAQNVQGY